MGDQMMLLLGYTPMMPKNHLAALMWYNVTAKANTNWRKRWFHHLLGDESEVLLRRSMFHEKDAVVRLLIVQKSKSNKKNFVISYPIG
jgi:hypothetical protein